MRQALKEEPEPPVHEHKWSTEWSSDGEYHWHECLNPDCPITRNSDKDGYGAHKYDDEHDATCNVCGHVREVEPEHEHKWGTAWSYDGQHHWHECLNPDCDITDNAEKDGYVQNIDAYKTAYACKLLGAGRERKSDPIDYSAGIYLNKIYGERVSRGDVIATLYANDEEKLSLAKEFLKDAFTFSDYEQPQRNLIYRII